MSGNLHTLFGTEQFVTIPTEKFQAYGRVSCYYRATGLDKTGMQRGSRAIRSTLKNTCAYVYPVPQCTENGTKKPSIRHGVLAVMAFLSLSLSVCSRIEMPFSAWREIISAVSQGR